MLKAVPGEIIAYCDDDVFMLPGWLERHLEVIDTYPNVGAVTGMYIKPHMKEGIASSLKFAKNPDVKAEYGTLVDRELEQHYVEQTGRSWEKYTGEISGLEDVRITYKGIQTFVSAGHYQFAAKKSVILQALPATWTGNLMGQMRELDIAIDKLGLLRLCTTPPTLRLLGNLIDQSAANELRKFGVDVKNVQQKQTRTGWKKSLLRSRLVQKVAYYFYERLFKIINS
jgi:hypothetical protein